MIHNQKYIKNSILSIIILFSFSFNAFGHVEHYASFNYLEYDLFRNNKLIGYHKYNFIRNNKTLNVKSEVSFNINKLGIDIYNKIAKSEEIYQDNKFYKFSSKTNQNKKKKYVNISVADDDKSLIIDGSSYKGEADIDIIVGTWWNHKILKTKAQISAISGRVIDQTVTFVGKEEIMIRDKIYKTLILNLQMKVYQTVRK